MRLTSEFWVSATRLRLERQGLYCVVRHVGARQSGAITIMLNRLDGSAALFGPAPSALASPYDDTGVEPERAFLRLHHQEWLEEAACEARLKRALAFDADVWALEIEDRNARAFEARHPALEFLWP